MLMNISYGMTNVSRTFIFSFHFRHTMEVELLYETQDNYIIMEDFSLKE